MKDPDTSHLQMYKRGMVGTFVVRIDVEEEFGAKTKITVVSFNEDPEA